MKNLTLKEIADLAGIKPRAAQYRAKKEGWKYIEERHHKTRRRLYPVKSLPKSIERAVLDKALNQMELPHVLTPESPPIETPIQTSAATLKDWQRERMEARAAILAEVERIGRAVGIEKAIREVVRSARDGALPDHLQRRVAAANAKGGAGGKRTVSPRTQKRWRADARKGATGLAPKSGGQGVPAWGAPLLKTYRQPQKWSLAKTLRKMAEAGIGPLPSYDQARRFLARVGEVEKNRGRMGPRELKSIRPFVRRTTGHMLPTDCYTADGHTFDAEVAHPIHGKAFRPEVTLVIDIATRLAAGWSCTLAESGLAVLDAIRHACTRTSTKPCTALPGTKGSPAVMQSPSCSSSRKCWWARAGSTPPSQARP